MKRHTKTFLAVFIVVWILIVLWRLSLVIHDMTAGCPRGKVCLTHTEFNSLQEEANQKYTEVSIDKNYTRDRDVRVLQDPLYPALNRTDRNAFDSVVESTINRRINVPTQSFNDTYRLVGYLSNNDDEIGRWKLFGRQKDKNRGDYYMIPVDRQQDMKVQVTDSITVGEKLRDLDTIPNQLTFKSPLLASTPYTFTELPKADLSDGSPYL